MEKSKGARLREERERLGLSQAALGELGGVRKLTQLKYEQDESSPGWDYFETAARLGLDVLYVINGTRSTGTLSSHEQALLGLYQAAPLAVRAAAIAALASGSTSTHGEKYRGATIGSVKQKSGTSVQQNFNGPVGKVEPGDTNRESKKK